MKKISIIIVSVAIITSFACKKPAEACFTYSPQVINTYTDIVFDASCSENASTYIWYFGNSEDGESSSEPTITHRFTSPGTYVVTLGIQKDGKKAGKDKLVIQKNITVQ